MPHHPPAECITCPRCGRTSFKPNDVEHGWCGHCHAETAPAGVHPYNVTIHVAVERARLIVRDADDTVAVFVTRLADLLEVCELTGERLGTVGHVAAYQAALSFLAATRHLEVA